MKKFLRLLVFVPLAGLLLTGCPWDSSSSQPKKSSPSPSPSVDQPKTLSGADVCDPEKNTQIGNIDEVGKACAKAFFAFWQKHDEPDAIPLTYSVYNTNLLGSLFQPPVNDTANLTDWSEPQCDPSLTDFGPIQGKKRGLECKFTSPSTAYAGEPAYMTLSLGTGDGYINAWRVDDATFSPNLGVQGVPVPGGVVPCKPTTCPSPSPSPTPGGITSDCMDNDPQLTSSLYTADATSFKRSSADSRYVYYTLTGNTAQAQQDASVLEYGPKAHAIAHCQDSLSWLVLDESAIDHPLGCTATVPLAVLESFNLPC